MTGDRLFIGDRTAITVAPSGDADLGSADPAPQVDLVLESGGAAQTCLRRQHAAYPFHVGRTWHVTGDPPGMLTLYVQSCSGGVFQHDDLRWRLRAESGAKGHVTTAASTIVHRMDAGSARQRVELHAAADAVLEYLPDPLILFHGARFDSRLSLHVHDRAVAMAWEALIPHDPAGQDGWFDWLLSETSICDDAGRLLARDRYRVAGSTFAALAPGVTGGWRCQGVFFVAQRRVPQAELVDALRAALPGAPGVYAGAGSLPARCGAWVRMLSIDAVALRETQVAAWYAARRVLLGVEPVARRK